MRKENYYYESWLGISRCIQIAQDLRLSQHAAHHQRPNACDSSTAKCRLMRRIWQTIYVVEVMISYPKGTEIVHFNRKCANRTPQRIQPSPYPLAQWTFL